MGFKLYQFDTQSDTRFDAQHDDTQSNIQSDIQFNTPFLILAKKTVGALSPSARCCSKLKAFLRLLFLSLETVHQSACVRLTL